MIRNRILITGGAGFIGANLIRRFLKENAQVSVVVKPSTNAWRLEDIEKYISIYKNDLSEQKKLSVLLKQINPDFIFHLAAYGNSFHEQNIDEMVSVNIKGTLNLLWASLKIPYKCLVNTGASSEYGKKSKPMKEEDTCIPNTFYGATKLSGTSLCQVFSKQYKKPIATFRPFSVYGPFEERSRFIPSIIKALIKNNPIKLTLGPVRHDFIFVDDYTDACMKVLEKYDRLGGEIINIGTGKEYTNKEVTEVLFKVAKKKTEIKEGHYEARSWDTRHWAADISKAKRVLNWRPRHSLEQGLKKSFEWFKTQNIYEDQ